MPAITPPPQPPLPLSRPPPGGSIVPSGAVSVAQGADQNFTITSGASSYIQDVLLDGSSALPDGIEDAQGFLIEAVLTVSNITQDHTVEAVFALKTYTITATAGTGGSIAPAGDITVEYGADQTFNMTPDAGYQIADVLVDGASIGATPTYTFLPM